MKKLVLKINPFAEEDLEESKDLYENFSHLLGFVINKISK
jgi:hypothetical protein